eukprot:441739-Hanusia_phi.AAC.1
MPPAARHAGRKYPIMIKRPDALKSIMTASPNSFSALTYMQALAFRGVAIGRGQGVPGPADGRTGLGCQLLLVQSDVQQAEGLYLGEH